MSETQSDQPRPSRPMLLVAERQTPDPQPAPLPPPSIVTTPPPAETQQIKAWRAGAIGAVNVIAAILAVRLTLLVGVAGAIGLTWLALQQPDPVRLIALGIYVVGTIPALTWLAGRR